LEYTYNAPPELQLDLRCRNAYGKGGDGREGRDEKERQGYGREGREGDNEAGEVGMKREEWRKG